uniref:UPF0235 protein C15orf40 homolog isoform X3 n=1 Tax=Scatophagus argus TaxID=75038 RepID=UPI001ED7DE0D|nr:UPF0235 protein C15orf40 homolog isoform X3 [Scatophagus argus]
MFPRSVLSVPGRFLHWAQSTRLHGSGDAVPVGVLPRSRLPPLPGGQRCRSRHMPRKDKAQVKGHPAGGAAAEPAASCPVSRDKSGAVTIMVHAKPGSKHSSITEVCAEAVGVAIAAPPADGEANTELIRYLAEVLELKKSHISLDKVPEAGYYSFSRNFLVTHELTQSEPSDTKTQIC